MAEARKVPFFNYPFVYTHEEKELTEIFQDVGRRGAFILQQDLRDFEKNLAEFMGVKFALGVSNGTDGLLMALRAAGIGRGDEVIFCSHTFIATAAAIHYSGATPIPAETNEDHQIDPEHVKTLITSKTKAIMPTQLNGRCSNMEALQKIADDHGLHIIEDAAQGLGATFKGKMAGTFGIGAAMSFYPAKVLGCLGDGGAVFTNDENIYENYLLQRDHGRDHKTGEVVAWGLNLRLDNLQAAFLNHRLKKYPEVIKRRREMAGMYQEFLEDIEEIVLPPAPTEEGDYFDIYQNYEVRVPNRDEYKAFLAEHGVGTLIQWGGQGIHQMKKLGFTQSLPKTEDIVSKIILLPMNMSLSNDDIEYVCGITRKYFKK